MLVFIKHNPRRVWSAFNIVFATSSKFIFTLRRFSWAYLRAFNWFRLFYEKFFELTNLGVFHSHFTHTHLKDDAECSDWWQTFIDSFHLSILLSFRIQRLQIRCIWENFFFPRISVSIINGNAYPTRILCQLNMER